MRAHLLGALLVAAGANAQDTQPIATITPGGDAQTLPLDDTSKLPGSAFGGIEYRQGVVLGAPPPSVPVGSIPSPVGHNTVGATYDTARDGRPEEIEGVVLAPGDIRYATLNYGFVSDDAAQAPVFATLQDIGPTGVTGFLEGSTLQGQLRFGEEAAVIEFQRLILQDGRTLPISAIAISPDLMRTGFGEVDRNRLRRYGALLVAGLIEGAGAVGRAAIDRRHQGDQTVIIIGDGNRAADDDLDEVRDRELILGTLEPLGSALSEEARQTFREPPTITAPAGTGIGVVFLEPVTMAAVR